MELAHPFGQKSSKVNFECWKLLSAYNLFEGKYFQKYWTAGIDHILHKVALCKWFLDNGHSRSFWKDQDHLELTPYIAKKSFFQYFNSEYLCMEWEWCVTKSF
jgi:hypothetical protein